MLPRSEVPEELHPGAGHGTRHDLFLPSLYPLRRPAWQVVKPVSCISAALGASESHTWKIASPGGVSGVPLSLSSYPVAGRGRSLPETLFRVKRIFEIFCAVFLHFRSKPRYFVRVRVKKLFFTFLKQLQDCSRMLQFLVKKAR